MTTSQYEERLDELTTTLLVPLRTEKRLELQALDELCSLVAEQKSAGLFVDTISVRLAGKFWWIFCSMLSEADHAKNPEPILDAAWRYQEELRRAFGPVF